VGEWWPWVSLDRVWRITAGGANEMGSGVVADRGGGAAQDGTPRARSEARGKRQARGQAGPRARRPCRQRQAQGEKPVGSSCFSRLEAKVLVEGGGP